MNKMETFVAGMVFMPLFAAAQQAQGGKTDSLKTPNVAIGPRIVRFSQMDQRRIYHWGNGQRSTPTGREAGERLSGFVKLFGDDSAVVVDGPVK